MGRVIWHCKNRNQTIIKMACAPKSLLNRTKTLIYMEASRLVRTQCTLLLSENKSHNSLVLCMRLVDSTTSRNGPLPSKIWRTQIFFGGVWEVFCALTQVLRVCSQRSSVCVERLYAVWVMRWLLAGVQDAWLGAGDEAWRIVGNGARWWEMVKRLTM